MAITNPTLQSKRRIPWLKHHVPSAPEAGQAKAERVACQLEAALHEIRDADCRGEVCKGIACVALNVAYPTLDRGGEPT